MRTSILTAGIVILLVGLGFLFVPGALGGGAIITVVGVIVSAIGAAIKRPGEDVTSPTHAAKPAGQPMMASGAMESMVKMLAEAPESQRRQMIKTRLSSFAGMNDADRVNAMKAMISTVQKLQPEAQRKVTFTRLESLAEDFDSPTRKKLMGTHMMVLMSLPKEQMMADINAMVSAMGQCHDACRMKDVSTMKELMMEVPQDKRSMMMQMLPPDVQKMLMA